MAKMTPQKADVPAALTRRTFLTLCALGGLSAVLSACQGEPQPVSKKTPLPGPTQTPSPRPTPAEADWSALGSSLQGMLIRPDSPQYTTARQLFDPRFDDVQPAALASCASPQDVQRCLAFGRQFSVSLALRSGGHSFAGYSTTSGLVVDVTPLSTISVDAQAGTATIGAGARLIDVYAALAEHGLALPAGSCPSVGIAGLTLGGGVGVLGRKFGLTCDNLLAADVVVADGRVLTCDASAHADLFWALRGGGGGNFGVVTSFTFRVHPVTALTLFTLNWAWSHATEMFDAWQRWAPQGPDELWSNCLLLTNRNQQGEPIARVNGVYVGGIAPLETLLEQLTSQIQAAPLSRYVASDSLLEAMLIEAGCEGQSVDVCHLPSQNPQGQVPRVTAFARSDYYTQVLPREGIGLLVSAIEARQTSSLLRGGGIGSDAYGGAINRVRADATAFVHRNAQFSTQYSADGTVGDSGAVIAANQTWLAETWQAMRPYASGASYQNYIDPDLTDWPQAYYGANLARLQQVKAAYDPENLFQFAQSIPVGTNG